MIEVVSVRFKNKGKKYFFAPNGLTVRTGDQLVVETAKGLEMADCAIGNHMVEDTAVILPLRPVVRIATADDRRAAEINRGREKEAFVICQQQIKKHNLEMKLVDVECSFEGNKTTFFFTAEDRVDFRELVKDLAGIFRNRIELRQIGVRDEAKLMGGIGICGRPYCCHQFMDDFQPVSTKMAKTQSLSLNPTKICGSCGRLMCCLRYEQEAYEELVKKVPKQGAFVETVDGYGTAVQVNLLRQTVKVRLDGDNDDSLHLYKPNEVAAVPGGRPRDGSAPPHVLVYVPEEEPVEEEQPANEWEEILSAYTADAPAVVKPVPEIPEDGEKEPRSRNRRRRNGKKRSEGESRSNAQETQAEKKPEVRHIRAHVEETPQPREEGKEKSGGRNRRRRVKNGQSPDRSQEPGAQAARPAKTAAAEPPKAETPQNREEKPKRSRKPYYRRRNKAKSGGNAADKQQNP